MRQITDEMVKIVMNGGGLNYQGFVFHVQDIGKKWPLSGIVRAISRDGQRIFDYDIALIGRAQIKTAIENILNDINSSTHLPKSAYSNGIRLDTEYRCQNQRCNPAGKRRLLFVSAGPMAQVMQVKCKCGYMNTFWKNRIYFDEYGAIQMKN